MSTVPKKCKGCAAQVVNPVTCPGCGINCHPGPSCLSRSGHSWSGRSLLNSRSGSPRTQPAVSQSIASSVQPLSAIPSETLQSISSLPSADTIRGIVSDIIDAKLAVLRDDILAGFRAELSDMRLDINSLSDRVKALEDKSVISSEQQPSSTADDVIEEWKEREMRSKNIIIFGIPEPRESSPELLRSADVEAARGVLSEICPLNTQALCSSSSWETGQITE